MFDARAFLTGFPHKKKLHIEIVFTIWNVPFYLFLYPLLQIIIGISQGEETKHHAICDSLT